jgi:cytochrome d ubiquinol oxidase subunit II
VVAAGGAVAAALGWGAVLGTLFVGVPWPIGGHPDQAALFAEPMTYFGALTMAALMVTHGATFLALRGHQTARHGQIAAIVAAALLLVSGGYLTVHGGQSRTALVILCLGVAALVAVRVWLRAARLMAAFTASTVAIAVPIVALAVTHLPVIVASSANPATGLTVAAAASGESTLQTLTSFALVAAPLMVASQLLSWWLFRTPAPRRPVRSGQ